jgi:hypothetical protein
MMRMLLRSRSGSLCLAVTGGVYALSALGVLVYFMAEQWLASASLIDRVLPFALIGAAACGVWFVVIGLENLGWRHHNGPSKASSIQR